MEAIATRKHWYKIGWKTKELVTEEVRGITSDTPRNWIEQGIKDVTKDIEDFVVSLNYSDYLTGKTDELELVVENRDGRWLRSWYPTKGDKLIAIFGLTDGASNIQLNAGEFEIDEIKASGPPDVVTIKALSAYITEAQRQRRTRVWEETTLYQVLADIAGQSGLTLEMERSAKSVIRFYRLDQRDKSDLAFLKELTDRYGYNAKIDSKRLIISHPWDRDQAGSVLDVRLGVADLKSYSFEDKTHNIYRAVSITYHDPVTKRDIEHTENADGVVTGDVLKLDERVENQEQAIARCKAELDNYNRQEKSGEITYMGHPWLTAGTNIMISGFGDFDGKYSIAEAKHSISRAQGYVTTCQVKRIMSTAGGQAGGGRECQEVTPDITNKGVSGGNS